MSIAALTPHLVSPLPSGPLPGVPAVPSLTVAGDDDDSFSFDDLLDAVNPLQHIPVIGTLYRAITGDKIATAPKILGDTLYGGATGFVASVADTIFEKVTGKSVGDTVLALVEDAFSSPSSPDAAPATAIASAAAAPLALPAPDSLAAIPSNTSLAALTAPQAPVSVLPAQDDAIVIPGQDELLMALNRAGVGQDVALRAADAYRRTISVSSAAADGALPNGFRASIAQ